MALEQMIKGDSHVTGTITCGGFVPPPGSITNAAIQAAAGIDTTKVDHRHAITYQQAPGTAIVAATHDAHICRANGVVLALEAAITGAIATGGDRTVDVDVQLGNAAAGFATILTGTVQFTNSSTLRAVVSGTVASDDLADGDILRIVITVAGAAGNQAQGLVVTITLDEEAQ
jgi:hypothetical protein